MWPKFGNSSISMSPEKPRNQFPTILNLVTSCFHIKLYCANSPNCFSQKIWIFSYSIQLHISSASHPNKLHFTCFPNCSIWKISFFSWSIQFYVIVPSFLLKLWTKISFLELTVTNQTFYLLKFGIAMSTAGFNWDF